MINFIIKTLTGSFLRTLGRLLCYLFIMLIIYFILNKMDIDWSVLIR